MGTKRSIDHVTNGGGENLSVPPGFVSLTSFALRRVTDDDDPIAVGREFKPRSKTAPLNNADVEKFKASFSRRPWINHGLVDCTPQKCDPEPTDIDMKPQATDHLPKGVIRGCTNCHDCVKVTAGWHPEESQLTVLDDAPVFHPNAEEFEDTLKYIAKIRSKAEDYGICRIVPPPSWRPPCLLKDQKTWEASNFNTRVQLIDGLKKYYLKKKLSRLHEKMATKMTKVFSSMEPESCNEHVEDTKESQWLSMNSEFKYGPEFTLQSFKKYADDFKKQYFCKNTKVTDPATRINALQEYDEPLTAAIEGEYWRIIENPTEEIEVLFGTDLENRTLGSGFPVRASPSNMAMHPRYVASGWNLNNTPKLSGSLLPFGCYESSSFLVPQPFFGMCFATQCWKNEEHCLYSLCYMHLGDARVWYGIPGKYCFKFIEVVTRLFPQLSKHPELLQDLITQISPSRLKSEGIPVYRCVQNSSEFVLIFPGAFHSAFSCGFNCSESVCFAPPEWLPQGQDIVEIYSGYCWRNSISHDKLLLQAAMEAAGALWEFMAKKIDTLNNRFWVSVCQKGGILTEALKSRVRLEGIRRQQLCNLSPSRFFDEFDTVTKRECNICMYDLYLSGMSCSCSPNKYSCLRHAKQLCSCAWDAKCFFFRYEIAELNLLVEALEGNLKATFRWSNKRKVHSTAGVSNSKDALLNERNTRNGDSSKQVVPVSYGSLIGNGDNKNTVRPTSSLSRENKVHGYDSSASIVGSFSQENKETRPSNQNDVIIVIDEDE